MFIYQVFVYLLFYIFIKWYGECYLALFLNRRVGKKVSANNRNRKNVQSDL